jgi:hypothetical protein
MDDESPILSFKRDERGSGHSQLMLRGERSKLDGHVSKPPIGRLDVGLSPGMSLRRSTMTVACIAVAVTR